MAIRYMTEVLTPEARAAERAYYGREHASPGATEPDELGPDERAFIEARDSFYMATVTSTGWPYVQHRGGPPGFLKVLGPRSIGFADLRGNRQLVTTGNVAATGRVSLMLMDYPRRARLKILGHARVVDARADAELAERVSPAPELRRRIERVFVIDVVGFDWNCPAYITPRYTAAEVEAMVEPLRRRLAELEAAAAAAVAAVARG